jgi:hypothetical protein
MTCGHKRLGTGFEEIRLHRRGRLPGVFRRHFAGVYLVQDLLPSVRDFHGIQYERDFFEEQLAFFFSAPVHSVQWVSMKPRCFLSSFATGGCATDAHIKRARQGLGNMRAILLCVEAART